MRSTLMSTSCDTLITQVEHVFDRTPVRCLPGAYDKIENSPAHFFEQVFETGARYR